MHTHTLTHTHTQTVLDKMTKLQKAADQKGVKTLSSRAERIMNIMGFSVEEGEHLVASFSGGWKMRIGLGKILLTEPNILLLDEVCLPQEPCIFAYISTSKTDLLVYVYLPTYSPTFCCSARCASCKRALHIIAYSAKEPHIFRNIHVPTSHTRINTTDEDDSPGRVGVSYAGGISR